MRIVYHAAGIVDAHLVKDALEHAEIPAFINGEYLIGGVGQLPARDFLSVSVPDTCFEAADPIVREISEMLRAPVADPEPADVPLPSFSPVPV
ncbi:MAG TPA: DUF2007 domain-containing protein [Rhodanobacteraceae bacterium]